MEKKISCEERIGDVLERRIEDMKEVVESEDPIEKLNEYALALSKTELYKLELSSGGPQDYFVFEYDAEFKELLDITYHFLDWFDGAKRNIPFNSEEWKILEKVFYSCIHI